jgi:RsiW-degrading membrane proteinase PrsW (M82 family)
MTDFGAVGDLVILWLAAMIPAVAYLAWVRKSERYLAEAWGPLLWAFVYGALFATIVAAILETVFVALGTDLSTTFPAPEFVFLKGNSSIGALFLVLVIAPFVEEALKASGVARNRDRFHTVADGPVFGASVGLGFGFFETFLYGIGLFLTSGLVAALGLIVIRSLSSVLLHGSSTGMFGYGYARQQFYGQSHTAGLYYLVAVLMHATFNFLASGGGIAILLGYPQYATYADYVGLLTAILFAFLAIEHVRSLVGQTNYPGAQAMHPQFRPPPIRSRPGGPPGNR